MDILDKEKNNNSNCNCSNCYKNEPIFYCINCKKAFCIECKDIINFEENEHKIIIIKNNKFEKAKTSFLNSLSFLIKSILKKCNFLLKKANDNIKKLLEFDNKSNSIIKKVFKYPKITDLKDFNSHLNFLIEINSIINKEMFFNELSLGSFHISEMDTCIVQLMNSIGRDDKIDLFKENVNIIGNWIIEDEDYSDKAH